MFLPHILWNVEFDRSCLGVPVSAQGLGLVSAVADETADFYVNTNGLRGSLKVQVDGTEATHSLLNVWHNGSVTFTIKIVLMRVHSHQPAGR